MLTRGSHEKVSVDRLVKTATPLVRIWNFLHDHRMLVPGLVAFEFRQPFATLGIGLPTSDEDHMESGSNLSGRDDRISG